MPYQFSVIEVQLIRSSLLTKTNEELSDLLGIEIDPIIEKINELTDGFADQRSADVRKFQEEAAQKRARKKRVRVPQKKLKESSLQDDQEVIRRRKIDVSRSQAAENRHVERKRIEARSMFKTRKVDYSEMKSIKVGIKAWIMVQKDADQNEAIALYQANKGIRESNSVLKKEI